MGLGDRGGVSFVSQGDASVVGAVLHDNQVANGYLRTVGPAPAPVCHDGDGFSAPTGAGGDENVAAFGGAEVAYHMLGTQTILAPVPANGRLVVGLDETAGDGVEYLFGRGLVAADNPMAMVAGGPGQGKLVSIAANVGTVANSAELAVGFRKAEAFNALLDSYTDFAVLNMQAGVINVETNLNGAGTVTLDTGLTMVDGVTRTLEVRLYIDGRVRFYVDGVLVGPVNFVFDAADVLLPINHWLQVTGGSSYEWERAEAGALWHARKDPFIQRA